MQIAIMFSNTFQNHFPSFVKKYQFIYLLFKQVNGTPKVHWIETLQYKLIAEGSNHTGDYDIYC